MNSELNVSKSKIESAKRFASEKFAADGKKNHFLDVFDILHVNLGVQDENILIAGLLHDVLEDTSTTYEEICNTFSKGIADLVREVSHPKNYNQQEKLEYYARIKHISDRAKLIKMADFASHLQNFAKIYEKGEQHLYPKFINNNKYVTSIREFLDSCHDSAGKEFVYNLTNKLASFL